MNKKALFEGRIVDLVQYHNKTFEEVAKITGLSESYVKRLYYSSSIPKTKSKKQRKLETEVERLKSVVKLQSDIISNISEYCLGEFIKKPKQKEEGKY